VHISWTFPVTFVVKQARDGCRLKAVERQSSAVLKSAVRPMFEKAPNWMNRSRFSSSAAT